MNRRRRTIPQGQNEPSFKIPGIDDGAPAGAAGNVPGNAAGNAPGGVQDGVPGNPPGKARKKTRLGKEALVLDDVVWRNPGEEVNDPTDMISSLASEADKIADTADAPEAATGGAGRVDRAARETGGAGKLAKEAGAAGKLAKQAGDAGRLARRDSEDDSVHSQVPKRLRKFIESAPVPDEGEESGESRFSAPPVPMTAATPPSNEAAELPSYDETPEHLRKFIERVPVPEETQAAPGTPGKPGTPGMPGMPAKPGIPQRPRTQGKSGAQNVPEAQRTSGLSTGDGQNNGENAAGHGADDTGIKSGIREIVSRQLASQGLVDDDGRVQIDQGDIRDVVKKEIDPDDE